MKKKIKIAVLCVLVGLFLSSCAIFGERKQCPAYSQVKQNTTVEQTA
ncbi:MAG: hypothetical protein KGV44_08380 [Flavobacteriaceae bacterium]|nr:hypothetical protein [Flavobacteriaceae bacterium]